MNPARYCFHPSVPLIGWACPVICITQSLANALSAVERSPRLTPSTHTRWYSTRSLVGIFEPPLLLLWYRLVDRNTCLSSAAPAVAAAPRVASHRARSHA